MQIANIATFCCAVALAACSVPSRTEAPIAGFGAGVSNLAQNTRRGAVEVIVKANHPALLREIAAGGGPTLTKAMDTAQIPAQDRPTRIIQLQGDLPLYTANPGALVVALMVYGR